MSDLLSFFFFSSRRRHTRCSRDWSSDVCSSDLGEPALVYKHALKNAMIPTITIIGISFAILIGGAIVVETVFNIPGLGRLIISAVLRRDYPVIQGVVLCIAGVYMLINLAVDLSYPLFDPRVRYQ